MFLTRSVRYATKKRCKRLGKVALKALMNCKLLWRSAGTNSNARIKPSSRVFSLAKRVPQSWPVAYKK